MPDNLTPAARSYCMSRVKSRDTAPEVALRSELRRFRIRFRTHARDLPGTPDFVCDASMIAVFVDGDFWHGYRFPSWQNSLRPFWRKKISGNRRRDQLNFRRLRRRGWIVVRFWQHQIDYDVSACVAKLKALISLEGLKATAIRRRYWAA